MLASDAWRCIDWWKSVRTRSATMRALPCPEPSCVSSRTSHEGSGFQRLHLWQLITRKKKSLGHKLMPCTWQRGTHGCCHVDIHCACATALSALARRIDHVTYKLQQQPRK